MSRETEKLKKGSKKHFESVMVKWEKEEINIEDAMLEKALGEILLLNNKLKFAEDEMARALFYLGYSDYPRSELIKILTNGLKQLREK